MVNAILYISLLFVMYTILLLILGIITDYNYIDSFGKIVMDNVKI